MTRRLSPKFLNSAAHHFFHSTAYCSQFHYINKTNFAKIPTREIAADEISMVNRKYRAKSLPYKHSEWR